MEMYAVIKTGGKQYRVAANDKILIEKLEGSEGDQVQFTDVLMVANGDSIDIGAPLVSGATVVGEIAAQEKSATVYIFKKRRRKHYRRRNGHRQLLTSVTITEILTGGSKPAAKAKVAKPVAEATDSKAAGKSGDAKATPKTTTKAAAKAATLMSEEPATDSSRAPSKASGKSTDKADDISLIGGIGPKMQQILGDLAITNFAQIAAWTEADIEKIEEHIKPKGRIAREEWVEQAKELMAGKPPRAKTDRERD
jgi:large subunit ribosomal protein L21